MNKGTFQIVLGKDWLRAIKIDAAKKNMTMQAWILTAINNQFKKENIKIEEEKK